MTGVNGSRSADLADVYRRPLKADEFALCLRAAGWTVPVRREPSSGLPSVLHARYGWVPPEYSEFLGFVDLCVHPEENAWFLSHKNFEEPSPFAFSWNEWELQSQEAAQTDGDSEWLGRIKAFWDCHLPLAMSVRSGYAFLAVVISGEDKGRVVYGREPEYEDVWDVCENVGTLFELVLADLLHERCNEYLVNFL